MNVAREAARGWSVELRGMLVELTAARLRWCVVCGRVGLWGWRPLCRSMAITWICVDRARCRDGQAIRAAKRQSGKAGARRPTPAHWGWDQPQAAVPGIGQCAEASCATGPHPQRRGDRR